MKKILILFVLITILSYCNNENGKVNVKLDIKKEIKRLKLLLNKSNLKYNIVPEKTKTKESLWEEHYFFKDTLTYVKVLLFPNKQKALEYGKKLIEDIEKFEEAAKKIQVSRLELIHQYTVNRSFLFIVRGTNTNHVNQFISIFTGK